MHPYHIVQLEEVPSTNSWAKKALAEGAVLPNMAIVAGTQTAGRGQMQTKWHDEPHKNLLLTLVVAPKHLSVANYFRLNEVVSLALLDVLLPIVPAVIKWPNDILVGTEKIAGVLIETVIKGDGIQTAIIGIGLNVNQTLFDGGLNATSLALATGRNFKVAVLLDRLLNHLHQRLEQLHLSSLNRMYNAQLFGLNETLLFSDEGGTFTAIVKGVAADGTLQLYLPNEHRLVSYRFKEVKWLGVG